MKLQTADNQILDVDDQIVQMFTVMKTMLQDLISGGDEDETPIKLQVDAKVLRQVIVWCEQHKKDNTKTAQSTSSSDESESDDDDREVSYDKERCKGEKTYDLDLDPWDEKFLTELDPNDEDAIFPLILAANYLDVPALLDTCCKYVARMIRGRTPQWIRKRFKLKCDFTEEQKSKIRQDLSWYDENLKISDDEDEPPKREASEQLST